MCRCFRRPVYFGGLSWGGWATVSRRHILSMISIWDINFLEHLLMGNPFFSRLVEDSTLGVFLWATDSAMNRHVPRPDRNET